MSAASFWWALSWICVIWYSTLTVYVAVKGTGDIRKMLDKLKESRKKT